MSLSLAAVAFLAPDYDSAIAWFCDVLGFELVEDVVMGPRKAMGRRRADRAPARGWCSAKAEGAAQRAAIGEAAGGRVGYFLETDDFDRDHAAFRARGVEFLETPRREPYGTVAVFADPWGGKWDLIEPRRSEARRERRTADPDLGARACGVLLLALILLGSAVTPFATGIALGYLLDPVVQRLQRLGLAGSPPRC